jgi:hypothetical protein
LIKKMSWLMCNIRKHRKTNKNVSNLNKRKLLYEQSSSLLNLNLLWNDDEQSSDSGNIELLQL